MGSVTDRACTLALLVAADAVFLWMFLATDPLEQIAAGWDGTQAPLAAAAFRFSADWRHGMAGNAWVYMPGFFVTAAAVWLHARHAPSGLIHHAERVMAGLVALLLAFAGAVAAASIVTRTFIETYDGRVAHVVPAPSLAGAFSGVYTLVTWSVFVAACRRALVHHTVRPFAVPAILTIGLALLRPWTVGDFTSHWARGTLHGEAAALISLALVLVVAALLAASDLRSPKPQPGEASLHDGGPARAEDEEQVSRYGNDIEAR